MTTTHVLAPQLRMPTAFGPAPGPRNVPHGVELPDGPERISTITLTAPGREADLQPLVPAGCTLLDGTWSIQITSLSNLHWFGGHGYNIIAVSIPVVYDEGRQRVEGQFLPVMWESKADPILTGREELGFPKIFADIDVYDLPDSGGTSVAARASWGDTTFFAAHVADLTPAGPPRPALPAITRRYIPAVGDLETADADYLTISNPVSGTDVTQISAHEGSGRFEFTPVTWRQIPFQYPIINQLAELELTGPVAVRAATVEGIFGMATNRRL